MEHVNSVKYIKISYIKVIQQSSGREILMQSEKLILGSMGTGIEFLSFLFAPLDADKSQSWAANHYESAGDLWWYPGTRERDIFSWLFWPHGEFHQGPHKSLIGLGSGEFGGQAKALGSGLSQFQDVIWGRMEHIIPTQRGWRDVYRYGHLLIHECLTGAILIFLVISVFPTNILHASSDMEVTAGDVQIL